MSSTNKTTYYSLPQFIGTDKPSWLNDVNSAFADIDDGMNTNKVGVEGATSKANQALNNVESVSTNLQTLEGTVDTLREAVQNYDNILNFKALDCVLSPNNVQNGYATIIQNTNKTLNAVKMYVQVKTSWTNPTSYTYTESNSSTSTFYDLFTVEDNCFKLNQTSLPTAASSLVIGCAYRYYATKTNFFNAYISAWFDGATTHIGFATGDTVSNMQGGFISINATVFVTGSVIPAPPEE